MIAIKKPGDARVHVYVCHYGGALCVGGGGRGDSRLSSQIDAAAFNWDFKAHI